MTDYTSVDTWRHGEFETFYVTARPPELPANYPLPKDTRALLTAADEAWVALDLALVDWQDAHDEAGTHPRVAQSEAEADAWDAFRAQTKKTDEATRAASSAVGAWLAANTATAARYELERLADYGTARRTEGEATTARIDAEVQVGRSFGLLKSWLMSRYAHDDKPRGIGPNIPTDRVRAYWENMRDGLPESTPLPGDSVNGKRVIGAGGKTL